MESIKLEQVADGNLMRAVAEYRAVAEMAITIYRKDNTWYTKSNGHECQVDLDFVNATSAGSYHFADLGQFRLDLSKPNEKNLNELTEHAAIIMNGRNIGSIEVKDITGKWKGVNEFTFPKGHPLQRWLVVYVKTGLFTRQNVLVVEHE